MIRIWIGKKSQGKLLSAYLGIISYIFSNRMGRLEILDELEEWHLLSAHYCFAWAFKSEDYDQEFSQIQLQPQSPLATNK